MRLFAIGDIHGCATALKTLVDAIPMRPNDILVTLGDYINKGPDSKGVLDLLINLYDQGTLYPLKGNHELKLLRAIEQHSPWADGELLVDAKTMQSYANHQALGRLADIPEAHIHFIRNQCQNWLETKTHIFVHATVEPQLPLLLQSEQALFWDKFTNQPPHQSGKIVVCAHTPQKNGQPLNLGHAICLDTAASIGQWLTCLEIESGKVWQANERGELRLSWIQNYLTPTVATV